MEARLKKVLQIIYKFHIANKKILFIGTPLKLNIQIKQLLKSKKHSFIPESVWVSGIITNTNPSFKHLLNQHSVNYNKNSKFLFNLKNQVDLIVILNEKTNLVALEESSLKRIPTISLNASYNLSTPNLSTYKVEGDFRFVKKTVRNDLFLTLLGSVLKKAELSKRKQNRISIPKKHFTLAKPLRTRPNIKKNGASKNK
jgi:hypothetical protein